jgi:hypothetical protein
MKAGFRNYKENIPDHHKAVQCHLQVLTAGVWNDMVSPFAAGIADQRKARYAIPTAL